MKTFLAKLILSSVFTLLVGSPVLSCFLALGSTSWFAGLMAIAVGTAVVLPSPVAHSEEPA